MELSIQKILREHQVKGVFHTHVSMGQDRGKYNFNREDIEKLFDAYSKAIKETPDLCIGLAEKPQQYLPVLADIDIKIKETEDTDIEIDGDTGEEIIHTEKHVRETVEIYQSVLRKIVEECTDEHLICVVLEKPLYRITKNDVTFTKHGFHLHFPYCFLSQTDQEVHLIPRVQELAEERKVFEDLHVEDYSKVIDSSSCKAQWLMYGASKDVGLQPYKVSKIFNSEGNEINPEQAFKKYAIFDDRERKIKIRGDIESYYPRILSIVPYGRENSDIKFGLSCPLRDRMIEKSLSDQRRGSYKKTSVIENLAIATRLVPMLSISRAEDRNEWMTVGWILYNIGDGCTEALDLWCSFSSRCENKYDEATCIYHWDRMTRKEYSIGSLKHFAKLDSPEKYKEYKKEQATKFVHDSLNGSHNDIAKILFAEYGDEIVCASITNKAWYHFVDNKWERDEEGVSLRTKISGEIVDRFTDIGIDLLGQFAHCADKGEQAMAGARIKQVQKMISNLKSAPFKNNVMRECCDVFHDKRFAEKLDMNPTIFPFKNGIYDLTLNIFRPGRPEDFISKTANIDYKEFSEEDEQVQDVFDYLEKVFPDKSVRQYFMDVSSDVFLGGNHQKNVYFWTGEGDNSKSVMQGMFEKMLGKLAIKFNTTVITGKKVQNGSANAELARAGGGVRMATMEEPDDDEMINTGILKNLSGNDSFLARDLFEKGKDTREIIPMFKVVFICNKLPKLKGNGVAVWNRVRVIPFESTFCKSDDPAPSSYEEQMKQKRFPMDKDFAAKIPNMLQAFAWVLLRHRLCIKERIEPEKVKVATAMYRKENDIYRQFIEECIYEDSKGGSGILSLIELYGQFKDWFKDSLPHHTIPIKNEVEEYFAKLWGSPGAGKKWKGYRIRTLADDVASGEAVVLNDDDLVDYSNNLPVM